jgi:hypothetical protein
MFVSKVGAYQNCYSLGQDHSLPQNIRHCLSGLPETNTLAYFEVQHCRKKVYNVDTWLAMVAPCLAAVTASAMFILESLWEPVIAETTINRVTRFGNFLLIRLLLKAH